MKTQTATPSRRDFLTAFFPRSAEATGRNSSEFLQSSEIVASDSELMNRRDFGRRSAVGLISLALLERMFNRTEAAESTTGTNAFTAKNVASKGINTQEGLINLASDMEFLPTEKDNSKFKRADFSVIVDQVGFDDLRKFFRCLEILKNEGYLSVDSDTNDIHKILEQTKSIKAVDRILLGSAGFRRDKTIVYGLTKDETFAALEHLNSNYKFPYNDPSENTKQYQKFDDYVARAVNVSLSDRNLYRIAQEIIAANLKGATASK